MNRRLYAVAAILLVLAGGITLTTWQAVRATRAERQQSVLRAEAEKARQNEAGLRQTAQTEANRAEAAATDLKLTLSTSDFLQSARFIAEDNANDALPFLARSLSLNPVNDAALTRLTTLLTYHSWMVPTLRFKHGGPVNSAEFSLDGKRIVTASADGTARVWDASTGQPLIEPMKCSFSVTFAEFSPDAKRIVTGSQDGITRVWDAQTGQPVTEPMKHGKETITYVSSVHFSPDGKRIVTGSSDNTARVWDAETGQPLTEPLVQGLDLKEKEKKEREEREKAKPKGNSTVYSINTVGYVNSADGLTVTGEVSTTPVTAQFSSDGERIVTASEDRTARVWDAQTGRPLTELMKHGSGVRAAQFSPDGKRIVTVARDGTARVWDAQTGQSLTEPMKHGSGVASAEFSADGKRIVTAAYDNTARVWNAQTGQLLEDPALHGRPPGFKQFSPDGKRMVSSSSGRIARVWDAQTGRPLTEPMKHGVSVSTAQFSPDGERILTASGDHAAYVWEARTGPPLSLRPPLDLINSRRSDAEGAQPQFSHDGRRIVMPSADKTARVWDAQTGEPLTRISHDREVVSAQFSPDDQRIVTTSEDKTARLWDAQTGQPVTEPMKHEGELYSAEFAPDGKRIATGSVENTRKSGLDLHAPRFSPDGKRLVAAWGVNRLWDVQTGQPLTEPIKGVGKPPQFNPNTPWGIAGVLDTQTGQPLIKPMMHGGQVNSAQFSSDGKRIVTASADKTARVWDAQTGQPLTEPMIHGGDVRTAQFSPDGKRIVTASYYGDATARVWDAQTGQPLTEPISPGGHVFSVQFSPDGKRIVTASEGTARVWDAQTGQPLTEPMTHGDKPFSREGFPIVEPFSAQFSPDGKRIVTATTSPLDRKAHVWDVAPTQAGCPDWLLQLAEAISGKVLSKEGVLEPTRLNRVETLKQIRQKLAAQPEDDWVVWGRWLLADRTTRTISPFAKLTVPEQVNRNIQENTLASLQEATRLSPTNSLAFARLALVVKDQDPTKNPARLDNAEFYARFAMRLEPDNSAAWQSLGAVQSLQHQPEALETIDRALELQPGNAQAWEVRGEILENTNRLADALAAYNRQVELLPADTNQETRGALLNRARVLRQLGRWEEAGQNVGLACDIPRREARDLPNLIDLSAFYNAGFKGNWHGDRADNDLSELPVGIQAMAGTQFDVRGLIQLCGDRPATSRVPEQIAGVPTLRKCGRVHFLHGVIRGYNPTNTVIGKYVFHYADGTSQERPLVLGKDVLDWWTLPPESTANDGLIVAWIGQNGKSRDQGGTGTIQLYKTIWENPSPQVELTGIDFISAKEISAPFLVAITVE
ncbi:MAG: hypothetical protein HOP33_16880 [Verrucomicrobia bacterium]|nr:hypothetical protein [Verrucomicrobiota bacterium]